MVAAGVQFCPQRESEDDSGGGNAQGGLHTSVFGLKRSQDLRRKCKNVYLFLMGKEKASPSAAREFQ